MKPKSGSEWGQYLTDFDELGTVEKPRSSAFKQPDENVVAWVLEFVETPTIKVREEYLIYDTVAMISAIGGTIGLCIGLSFFSITEAALDWLQLGINWHQKSQDNSQEVFIKTNSIAQSSTSSLSDIKEELIKKLYKENLEEIS